MIKKEGKTYNINKEVSDQKIIEVSKETPDNAKISDKQSFDEFKGIYKGQIEEKCLADYGTIEDEKLLEDTAKELYLQTQEYIPQKDEKVKEELDDKLTESKELKTEDHQLSYDDIQGMPTSERHLLWQQYHEEDYTNEDDFWNWAEEEFPMEEVEEVCAMCGTDKLDGCYIIKSEPVCKECGKKHSLAEIEETIDKLNESKEIKTEAEIFFPLSDKDKEKYFHKTVKDTNGTFFDIYKIGDTYYDVTGNEVDEEGNDKLTESYADLPQMEIYELLVNGRREGQEKPENVKLTAEAVIEDHLKQFNTDEAKNELISYIMLKANEIYNGDYDEKESCKIEESSINATEGVVDAINTALTKCKDADDIQEFLQNIIGICREMAENNNVVVENKEIKTEEITENEIIQLHQQIEAAEDMDEIQQIIYTISDGVLEDEVQLAFEQCERDRDDLESTKDFVITTLEDNAEYLEESKFDRTTGCNSSKEDIAKDIDRMANKIEKDPKGFNKHTKKMFKDIKKLDKKLKNEHWEPENLELDENGLPALEKPYKMYWYEDKEFYEIHSVHPYDLTDYSWARTTGDDYTEYWRVNNPDGSRAGIVEGYEEAIELMKEIDNKLEARIDHT